MSEAGKGVLTPTSLEKYREGWDRVFGGPYKSTAQWVRETLDRPKNQSEQETTAHE